MQPALVYVTGLAVFVVLDAVWLTLMVPRVYKPAMGDLVADGFSVLPAILFYLIYAVGLGYFAITPALTAGRWQVALVAGALFGGVAYATYDLTNQATLKAWPLLITVIDLAWGTVASGLAAVLAYLVLARFLAN